MGSNHLTDDQLLSAAYGVAAGAEEQHLAGCRQCSESVARLARSIRGATRFQEPGDALPDGRASEGVGALDSLPDAFWQRQRAAVLAAVSRPAPRPMLRPAFVLATVVLALVALGVSLLVSRPPRPLIRAEDEQLFREVCETANRIEPEALKPVTLLLPADARNISSGSVKRRPATVSVSTSDAGVVFRMDVTDSGGQ